MKGHLKERGMAMKQGTNIDATLIAATSSSKNKDGKRDPEMHQTKKGNQWYKRIAGLIHSVETTAANMHDVIPAADKLHGEKQIVYADAGYQGIEKQEEMAGKPIEFRVAMRPGKRRALPDNQDGRVLDLVESAKAHICAKIEHLFRVI